MSKLPSDIYDVPQEMLDNNANEENSDQEAPYRSSASRINLIRQNQYDSGSWSPLRGHPSIFRIGSASPPNNHGTEFSHTAPIQESTRLVPPILEGFQEHETNALLPNPGLMEHYLSLRLQNQDNELFGATGIGRSSHIQPSVRVPNQQENNYMPQYANLQQSSNPFLQGQTSHPGSDSRQPRIRNSLYDPLYAEMGLPVDPHLRLFLARRNSGSRR